MTRRPWNNAAWVSKTPIVTVFLLEYANIGQLWRMWSVQSALGQNLWSWIAVNAALWLWWNFYRVLVPKERFARRATEVGILLNAAVVLTVVWFRYVKGVG